MVQFKGPMDLGKYKSSRHLQCRLGGHGWRPCVWLCKGQCCRHCHKTYKLKLGFMYGLMVVVERFGDVGISTHTAGKSNSKEDLPQKLPVHNNSTSSLGQTSASHFASTIALVLANLGPLVLASSLMRSRAHSFMKSRASESVETREHRSCVYRQCILVINLRPGARRLN